MRGCFYQGSQSTRVVGGTLSPPSSNDIVCKDGSHLRTRILQGSTVRDQGMDSPFTTLVSLS